MMQFLKTIVVLLFHCTISVSAARQISKIVQPLLATSKRGTGNACAALVTNVIDSCASVEHRFRYELKKSIDTSDWAREQELSLIKDCAKLREEIEELRDDNDKRLCVDLPCFVLHKDGQKF